MKKEGLKRKLVRTLVLGLITTLLLGNTVFATGIQDTIIATGTQKLISDLTSWLMVLAPTLTVLLVGYFLLRKASSQDQEGPRWNDRIKVAIICCVGVIVASALINVILSYYQ